MVEARGVEPLSENAASKESTYLVAFHRGAQSCERTRKTVPHVHLSR